jgi:hypothetical protein
MAVLRRGPDPGGHLLRALFGLPSPFKSLTLLMRTLILLSLFSFVVKFGLMVQITDLWQFLLFLFPAADHHAAAQTADAKAGRPVGTADCLYGVVYFGDQPAGLRLCLVSQR